MTNNSNDLYRKYLLGGLQESERTQLEELLIQDPEVFDLIEAHEADLIDEWVRGELSPEDQRTLKARSRSSPRLLERYQAAMALNQWMENPPKKSRAEPPRYRAWFLAAGLVGVVVLSQVTSSTFQLREQPSEVPAHVLLWGESLRGGGQPESVVIAPGQANLEVRVDLAQSSSPASYQLFLRGPDGGAIWKSNALEPGQFPWGSGLRAPIPITVLVEGAHQVEVREKRGGRESPVAFYELEIRFEEQLR